MLRKNIFITPTHSMKPQDPLVISRIGGCRDADRIIKDIVALRRKNATKMSH